tara:strand:- start:1518 stop:2837 length:1320 start_codon:yes stop_codon:yes gene_type:complete
MWTYYPELLRDPVPRYTSYPTAADFDGRVDAAAYAEALRHIPPDTPLSLYVHIPFCEEICWYCGCNTARSNKRSRLSAYLDALQREITLVAGLIGGRGRVKRISFGGGSPNALDPLDFVRLLGDLTVAFKAESPLISLEIDPRHFSRDWLSVIRAAKVANASLGVQSFAPVVQKAIGRVQPLDLVQLLARQLRDAGVRSLNFDLMYGLPHQDRSILKETLHQAADMLPDRIALFGYAHVPSVIPRQRRIDATALPGEAERFAMACMGHDFLVERGYQPVGFDHFALPHDPLAIAAREGRLNRNFQGFTDDRAEHLIGLGASAISEFPGLYVQNAKNAGHYRATVADGRLATERGVVRDSASKACGQIIKDILCHGEARLPAALTAAQSEGLEEFARRGLISTASGSLRLKPDAAPYARTIAALFDPRLARKTGSFSAPI